MHSRSLIEASMSYMRPYIITNILKRKKKDTCSIKVRKIQLVHASNPSPWEAEVRELYFKGSLRNIVSSSRMRLSHQAHCSSTCL